MENFWAERKFLEEGKFGPRRRSEGEMEDILRGKIIFGPAGIWRRKRRKDKNERKKLQS